MCQMQTVDLKDFVLTGKLGEISLDMEMGQVTNILQGIHFICFHHRGFVEMRRDPITFAFKETGGAHLLKGIAIDFPSRQESSVIQFAVCEKLLTAKKFWEEFKRPTDFLFIGPSDQSTLTNIRFRQVCLMNSGTVVEFEGDRDIQTLFRLSIKSPKTKPEEISFPPWPTQ
jgi:hypothetical protein